MKYAILENGKLKGTPLRQPADDPEWRPVFESGSGLVIVEMDDNDPDPQDGSTYSGGEWVAPPPHPPVPMNQAQWDRKRRGMIELIDREAIMKQVEAIAEHVGAPIVDKVQTIRAVRAADAIGSELPEPSE